jgi:hypothetical protein
VNAADHRAELSDASCSLGDRWQFLVDAARGVR